MSFLEGSRMPCGYQSFTPATAEGIDRTDADLDVQNLLQSARVALIKCETQPVRWRDDGTDPEAAVGMLLDAGEEFWYTGDLSAIKFIDTAAGASTVHVALYR